MVCGEAGSLDSDQYPSRVVSAPGFPRYSALVLLPEILRQPESGHLHGPPVGKLYTLAASCSAPPRQGATSRLTFNEDTSPAPSRHRPTPPTPTRSPVPGCPAAPV